MACHEAINAVELALSAIPGHYEKALRLVYLRGCTLQEAAVEMGRTKRAVQGLCRRGLKRLEKRLGHASKFFSSAK
ncbi:MAG: sigma-70 family RNA polymerase sigma factor [Planctomycetes bacterium]|nr:sigma-70 family RNA polymerase sigma factor [Planctomycetota bacterium]